MATKKWLEEHKEERRQYHNKWYARNKSKQKKFVNARRQKIADWFKEYKATLKCSSCPENHPATFDFHHLDPKDKEISVSEVVNGGRSIQNIKKEIEKCIVLCANCHRKLHYNE